MRLKFWKRDSRSVEVKTVMQAGLLLDNLEQRLLPQMPLARLDNPLMRFVPCVAPPVEIDLNSKGPTLNELLDALLRGGALLVDVLSSRPRQAFVLAVAIKSDVRVGFVRDALETDDSLAPLGLAISQTFNRFRRAQRALGMVALADESVGLSELAACINDPSGSEAIFELQPQVQNAVEARFGDDAKVLIQLALNQLAYSRFGCCDGRAICACEVVGVEREVAEIPITEEIREGRLVSELRRATGRT